MGRRRDGVLENLFEIASMLPWWVGLLLATIAYVVLHQVAVMEVLAPTGGKGMGDFVGKQLFKTFAIYLQYIVPVVLLVGALVSAFKRRNRKALYDKTAEGERNALDRMSWKQFEMLVGEHFRRRGFTVEENDAGGADGGVDLKLMRGADRYLVQCKQWRARQVGVAPVRELYGVMAAERAAGGYVVTSGRFTDEAKRFAEGREIELIDGEQLLAIVKAQSPLQGAPLPASGMRNSSSHPDLGSLPGKMRPNEVPSCPQCSAPMVLRTAKKGSNAGSSFWGCSTFPKTKCRGTRPVSSPGVE